MERRLQLTVKAIADLDDIYRWQSQPGTGAASLRRLQSIRTAIRHLQQNPCLHRRGKHEGTRELHVEGHTVIYRVHPDTGRSATAGNVTVLRVFGPGRSRETL